MKLDKVQIVGGGIGGLSAGVALHRAGVDVEVHEKFDELQGRATGFSIWAYAIKRLMEWGFDQARLDRIGREILESHMVDGAENPLMTLPIQEESEKVGAPSMDVDRRRLQEELIDLLGAERFHFGHEVTEVVEQPDRATVVLAGGDRHDGDLVIGADGIHSIVRDDALQQHVDLKRARYDVIEGLATLDADLLHRGWNRQIWGRKFRFGMGWVDDERVRWFLGGRAIALADAPPLSKADLLDKVKDMPQVIATTIEATGEDQIVRAEIRHGYPPERWQSDRVVLLGDAAHTLSPFAGMGACSTIEDVGHLMAVLDEADDLPSALKAFQEQRQGDVKRIEKTGRHNEQLMMPTNPIFYWARNEVLGHAPDEKLVEIARGMTADEG